MIYLAALGLSCSMLALVPWPGIEPRPPEWAAWSLNHWTSREVPSPGFKWLSEWTTRTIPDTHGSPSSLQFSRSVVSDSLWPHGLQHARPPCLSPTPRIYSNSCPLSRWCHPTISSSVVPFSSCLQCFPASGSFQMSQFFASGGQSTGVSASASVLPMNIQDWSPLGWTGRISLQSKGLSRVFSNTTVQKHQVWRRKWQPTPILLPGKFHERRSLVGYSPWGRKESDTTERLKARLVSSS